MTITYIIVIILLVIIILLYNKKENFIVGKESINNLASVYADVSGTVTFNNINILGKINTKHNMARYIRIGNILTSSINSGEQWYIYEVEVYDLYGTNIALNKPVTVISGDATNLGDFNNTLPEVIPDGNLRSNFYSGDNNKDHELEIDLGEEYEISQIIIYNNSDMENWSTGVNNTSIQLLDSTPNKNVNRIIFTGKWDKLSSKEYLL